MVNRHWQLSLLVIVFSFSLSSEAQESFRLSGGHLLKIGMTRIEVVSTVGEPLSKDIETHGISTEPAYTGKKIETWTYRLEGSIGGTYLVSLTLESGVVVAIYTKQQGRM